MIDFVRLNNRVVSAKSCAFTFGGVPYQGITAMDSSDKIDKELVYDGDQAGLPVGMTYGKYGADPASCTMLLDVFYRKFLPQFAVLSTVNLAPGSWGQAPPFVVGIQYVEPPFVPMTTLLGGCEILSAKESYAEGINAAVMVIGFQPLTILRNGLGIFNPTRGLL